ncbi:hypothetical protein [Oryzihumus sp.]|uniref:hypothetical protein n=1 Tax=Oryzihumus sp. TaxID=1968903 RepID=UPI002ED7AF6A
MDATRRTHLIDRPGDLPGDTQGALDRAGGGVRPRPDAPGHGLTVRWRDIDEHRVA